MPKKRNDPAKSAVILVASPLRRGHFGDEPAEGTVNYVAMPPANLSAYL